MTTNLPHPVVSSPKTIKTATISPLIGWATKKRHLAEKIFGTYDLDRKNFINLFWKIENDIFSTQTKIRLARAIELDENYLKEHYLTIISLPFKLRLRNIHVMTEFMKVDGQIKSKRPPKIECGSLFMTADRLWISQKDGPEFDPGRGCESGR